MSGITAARRVKRVWKSIPTLEGAGVHLKRVFGFHDVPQLDPFLLLDAFDSDNPADYKAGFPWHPHRGIETITYVLDGHIEHGDSLGNQGVITPGSLQWMTAGGGIIHQEMPKGEGQARLWGVQLWANLPKSSKMMTPRYRDVQPEAIPVVKTETGATVRVVAGEINGVKGPMQDIVIEPEFLDVSLDVGHSFTHTVNPDHTVFAFVMDGEGHFDLDQKNFSNTVGEIVLYGPGDTVVVRADKPVRFLLISGKPLNEPIAWHGPIVMNTQDELRTAFADLQSGRFAQTPV